MADAKISALPAASTPLAGTEVLPIVQSGTTKKVAVSSLTAGRAVSTGVLTVVNGTNPYIEMPDGTGTTYIQVASGDLNFVPRSGKNVSISNSNLVIGTAAKGIDFSANTHAAGMTSELLNDYEEGDWTPTQGAGLTVVGSYSATGKYTKIGRQVTIIGEIVGSTSVAVSSGGVLCAGLPYTTIPGSPSVFASGLTNTNVNATSLVVGSGTTLYASTAIAATTRLYFSATYLTT
jgi:hypothetical protein